MNEQKSEILRPCREGYVKPYLTYRALSPRVLAVAKPGQTRDWVVYVDDVPGENHDEELIPIIQHGCKQPVEIAAAMFPQFDPEAYRP